MNEIFDLNKLPERRIGVHKMIALHQYTDIGEAIVMAKKELAMALATKIMEDRTFFFERGDKIGPCSTLEYGADCIVLTREEYGQLRRQCFKEGVQHATGFMLSPSFFNGRI